MEADETSGLNDPLIENNSTSAMLPIAQDILSSQDKRNIPSQTTIPAIAIKRKYTEIQSSASSSSYQPVTVNNENEVKKVKSTHITSTLSAKQKPFSNPNNQVNKNVNKNLNKKGIIDQITDFSAFENKKQDKDKEKVNIEKDDKIMTIKYKDTCVDANGVDLKLLDYFDLNCNYNEFENYNDMKNYYQMNYDDIIPKKILKKVST